MLLLLLLYQLFLLVMVEVGVVMLLNNPKQMANVCFEKPQYYTKVLVEAALGWKPDGSCAVKLMCCCRQIARHRTPQRFG